MSKGHLLVELQISRVSGDGGSGEVSLCSIRTFNGGYNVSCIMNGHLFYLKSANLNVGFI
jgi:hypothetical protein